MNAKDRELIKDNPNKSLYELLDLGLTEKGFEEASNIFALKSGVDTPVVTPMVAAQSFPALQLHHIQATPLHDQTVMVLNIGRGSTVTMNKRVAESWCRRHPEEYKII